MGAEYDEFAPYNVKETTFKFELGIKGTAWYEYYGDLDTDEALDTIESRIREALVQLGDIEVKNIDISIY